MNTRYYILQFYINCDQCLDVFVAGNKREQGLHTSIQSDQQETKSRVLPHLLFYRNVFLS
jgi:hypothetical protein